MDSARFMIQTHDPPPRILHSHPIHFVTHPHEISRNFVCGLCNPPARAGKGKAAGALQLH